MFAFSVNKEEFGKKESFEFDSRYFLQTAERAMKGDIVRGLVELITNADDSYGYLEGRGVKVDGEIFISIERRRKGKPTIIKVRDRAEGMELDEMVKKLKRVGGRTSRFMETKGRRTRGLMGRGSKECVVFGKLKFQSIKNDLYSEVHLEKPASFTRIDSRKAHHGDRLELEIPEGLNGTVVTIEVNSRIKIPLHEWLVENLPKYYSLRDIASSSSRKILLFNANRPKNKPAKLVYRLGEGNVVIDEKFIVPGYSNAEAHLLVMRAENRIKLDNSPYWEGGILIKSGYAIHGISFFSRDIENNPYAEFYFGRLTCPHVDELVIQYEDFEDQDIEHPEENPLRIIDPLREDGLVNDHPFTKALYGEAKHRLKELLKKDEEAKKKKKSDIENKKTTERLKKLAGAASRFIKEKMEELGDQEEEADVDFTDLPAGGMKIVPGGANIVLGQTVKFYIYIRTGEDGPKDKHVVILNDSKDIEINTEVVELIDRGEGIYSNFFSVRGIKCSDDIRLKATWGLAAPQYVSISVTPQKEVPELTNNFSFEKEFYNIREGKKKNLLLFAKWPDFIRGVVMATVSTEAGSFEVLNKRVKVKYDSNRKAGVGTVNIVGMKEAKPATLKAQLAGEETSTKVKVGPKKEWGKNITIKVVDEDFGEQRATWDKNVLKIAGRHPSIQRYLGPADDGFPYQVSLHFRLLIAELVADNVARRILEANSEHEEMDAPGFYRKHRRYLNEFLIVAHKLQIAENELLNSK